MEPAGQNWPGLHAVTVVVVGHTLPSGHVAHDTLAVKLHAEVTYWPVAQVPQVVHVNWLDEGE